jgi:predicted nucleic acid-binding protein
MLVVADSSPLVVLAKTELIQILPQLFGEVIVPAEVAAELRHSRFPELIRNLANCPPAWLLERTASHIEQIPFLESGERAAISLAQELKADLLLIDEKQGRKVAAERQIPFIGTIGVLERAARQSLIELGDAFERVKATDFWISHELLDRRLRLFESR